MHILKNIVLIIIISITSYGLVGLKCIAYCCGQCEKSRHELVKETKTCCLEKHSEEETDDDINCEEIPCQFVSFDFDWDNTSINHVQLPPVQVIPLLAVNLPVFAIDHFFNEQKTEQYPPPCLRNSREILSFIHILLI